MLGNMMLSTFAFFQDNSYDMNIEQHREHSYVYSTVITIYHNRFTIWSDVLACLLWFPWYMFQWTLCTCSHSPLTSTILSSQLEIRYAERYGRWQCTKIITHQLWHSVNNKGKWLKEKSKEISTKSVARFAGEKRRSFPSTVQLGVASHQLK